MADPKKDASSSEDGVEETKASKGIPQLVIILGFVAIVLAEVIVGYFVIIPNSESTAETTKAGIEGSVDGKIPSFGGDYVDDPANKKNLPTEPQLEVLIEKKFSHRSPAGEDGMTAIQTFQFVLLVNKKDEKEFQEKYDSVTYQIQSAIMKIVAESTPKERADNNLTQIRNKIRVSVNGLLGKPYVNNVIDVQNNIDTM